MRRVVVVGGGFGGLATVTALRSSLRPDDEIVLLERRTDFVMGLRKSWAVLGRASLEQGRRDLRLLEARGIRVVHGTATKLDPVARAVEVDGMRIDGDALVVALGAEQAGNAIPGFVEHALNFYEASQVPHAAAALTDFRGGQVLVGIFGAPYPCPPAPFELALLLKETFAARGVAATLQVFSPLSLSLPVLGEEGCSALDSRLAAAGIGFLPNHKATAVEAGEVVFADGKRLAYDVLLGVPPHRCPTVVAESGLTSGGPWVRPDKLTLETGFPGVYAIGDLTDLPLADGKSLPKAGVFAEAQGRVVAERIAASFEGRRARSAFDGFGHCYLEVGQGQAMLVQGHFMAEPAPQIALSEPTVEAFAQKQAFEQDRLRGWFGA
ncbi:MAG TPA: FAD/NAD(P)-binding oxidoreductase [Anaerolineales bacterium]|nr:FAD/NAD(P)-binding oxidoreductase [Anaerolineales bacterium]